MAAFHRDNGFYLVEIDGEKMDVCWIVPPSSTGRAVAVRRHSGEAVHWELYERLNRSEGRWTPAAHFVPERDLPNSGGLPNNAEQHSGSKYLREIHPAAGGGAPIRVDVYSVLKAFGVVCPARAHAIKKLLCAGLRGKGDERQDLRESIDAIHRAMEMVRE